MGSEPDILGNRGDHSLADYIGNCQTQFDVQRACALLGERHGFRYFEILRMPQYGETRLADIAIATNLPASLIRQYDENNLLENSPIFADLRKSAAPIEWNVGWKRRVRTDGKEQVVCRLFKTHDINSGVYFNVHSASGEQGAVSFSGNRKAASESELMELNYHSSLIFDRTCALSESEFTDRPSLSKREKECITWTSLGKTSYEIGVILGLSEHTINNYLANVCRKLGAVNRAHLVGIALRSKILR